MSKKLEGKVALVTGGSRGIGAAIAKRLAADGAKVALTYGGSKDKADAVAAEIIKAGGDAFVIHGDANKPETMGAVVEAAVKKFGRLDILVNNAGIFEGTGPIDQPQAATVEALQRTLNINVSSVFTTTQAAVKHLSEGGRIVNISSVLGEAAIMPGLSIYVASKFAVLGLTRSWALDLAPRKITVNAVLPGPIFTDMGAGIDAAAMTPLGRHGTPEEVAATVSYLVSPEASFTTGTELRVSGGVNA